MKMTWAEIYTTEIIKKGGLLPFVLNKEKRSAGALIHRLKKKLKPGAKILEIGTGTGAISALLIKYGFDVTAIDRDEEMVDIAKKSVLLFGGSYNKVLCADAENIVNIFGKNSFDCVISHGMLEHYPDDKIILNIDTQLEVAPLIVFVVPMESMSIKYKSRGFGDERYISTKYWKNLLKKKFQLENIFGYGFKETNLRFFSERILKTDMGAKIFAPICAFNEFWINRNQQQ